MLESKLPAQAIVYNGDKYHKIDQVAVEVADRRSVVSAFVIDPSSVQSSFSASIYSPITQSAKKQSFRDL